MDLFAVIKAQMGVAVPYAAHTGVVIDDVAAGRAVASLGQRDETSNHVGSQHAGALFTLGEAASGAAMAGAFAEVFMEVRPVAAEAEIVYEKVAKGRITATATAGRDAATLRADLDAKGKVAFPVTVSLTDGAGVEVATMSVGWHVTKRKA